MNNNFLGRVWDESSCSCGCTLKSMKQTCPYGELFSEQVNRQIYGYIDRYMDTQIDIWIHNYIDRQIYRQIDRWIDRYKRLFLWFYPKVYETDIPLWGTIFRIG